MVDILRPEYGQVWASEGEKVSPVEDKISLGWVQEMMPFQWENFLQARQDEAITYLLQKGVPEWAATQEYTANKSVVQYQGNLYQATATVTGVLPTVTASWKRISPILNANGTVSVTGGGTGATTAEQARTNLGLGSASTATLPSTTGVVIKGSDNTLISRLLTGTSGDIVITNPDGVAGNINISVGSNVVKSNQDSSWTSKGGITLPKGSSSERGVEVPGKIRYNTELRKFEGFDGTSWGALGATSEVEITTLSGDGVTTNFTLNTPVFSESSVDVYIGGIWQNKGTYTVSGSTLTFSEAPLYGVDNIQAVSRRVVDLGIARASQVSIEDTTNLYTSITVEGALREVGEKARLVKNAILSYPDYASAEATAATLPDGQVIEAKADNGRPAIYYVETGNLVFKAYISDAVRLSDFLKAPTSSTAAAMELAALAAGKGARVFLPAGIIQPERTVNCLPVIWTGMGQGATTLQFDMSAGARNGIVFQAIEGMRNAEFGSEHLSVNLVGGHGATCFTTPSTLYAEQMSWLPHTTFKHLSFSSEFTVRSDDSWAVKYGWEWCFRLGESWNLTLEAIDALGCYITEDDPTVQFLDGFVRFQPLNGILSCRLSNITTHNIANGFELAGRTYFSAFQVDVARAYRGFYDADDRYFDPSNPYAYGECAFNFVIVNAQKSCWDLKYRYFTNFTDCAAHRTSDAFNSGVRWFGFNLPYASGCRLKGVTAGGGTGMSGEQIGFNFEGGSGNSVNGVSVGGLTTAFRMSTSLRPVEGTDSGPVRGLSVSDVSLLGNVGTMFDMVHVRDLGIQGVRTNNQGGYTVTTMVSNQNTASNTFLMKDIDGISEYQPDGSRLLWQNPNSPAGSRTWRWGISGNVMALLAANDSGTTGNNALIVERDSGTQNIKRIEFRTNPTGALTLFNTPESQFSGLIKPTTDNITDVGTANFRVKQYYGVSGAINTSDAREKTEPQTIDDALLDAWGEVGFFAWQWIKSVQEKGVGARTHYGPIAQHIRNALVRHGYMQEGSTDCGHAPLCYDEWEAAEAIVDDRGNTITPAVEAGNRWGIRADQCLFLEAAYQRRRADRIEQRLAAIESRLTD